MEATLDNTAFVSVAETLDAQHRVTFLSKVERLRELAANANEVSAFLRDYAQLVADLFAASTVAIWFPDPSTDRGTDSGTELSFTSPKVAVGFEHLRLDSTSEVAHGDLIKYALRQAGPFAIQPFSSPHPNSHVANPTDAFLLLTAITGQQKRLAVLEIALGPKPLRRPHQALVSKYVEWLAFLGFVLERGLQNAFARTPGPQRFAAELVYAAKQRAEHLREILRGEIEASLRDLAGQNFGTLRDNQQVVKQVHSLLESVALRVKCPECGEAAILRCQKAGNAKTGAFMYDHYLDSGRTFHGGQTTFPKLALVPKPARRKKA